MKKNNICHRSKTISLFNGAVIIHVMIPFSNRKKNPFDINLRGFYEIPVVKRHFHDHPIEQGKKPFNGLWTDEMSAEYAEYVKKTKAAEYVADPRD